MASRTESGRVRTDPRISRRRQAVARSKRRRVLWSLLAGALFAGAVWGAFWSPLLDVRTVQVLGAKQTSSQAVRDAVALGSDDNLLLLSTGEVAEAVEELPWVDNAEVHRRLPGTVRIKIEERKAALAVTVVAGTWTIDPSGRVLEEGASDKDLPTLTGAVLGELEPGQQLRSDEIRAGLKVWDSLPKKIASEVASVVAPARERIALALRDGTLVRYGGADHLAAKNEVLLAVMARMDAEGRSATYVDVSVPATPAIGPAPVGATPAPTPSV